MDITSFRTFTILLWTLVLCLTHRCVSAKDEHISRRVVITSYRKNHPDHDNLGYELLFRSNRKTWTNHSIQFDRDLPPWLRGSHFHNGPGLFEMGDRKFTHPFDGFAKVNKIRFDNETAWYSSQFVRSRFYRESLQKQSVAPFLLFQATLPPFSFLENVAACVNGLDNMNVNVKLVGDRLVTLTDIWQKYVIDPSTLDTIQKLSPRVPDSRLGDNIIPLPSAAHPVKAANGVDHITVVSLMDPVPFTKSYIDVIRMTSATDTQLIARIPRPWNRLPYMHSLAASPNYAIIFAHPVYIDQPKILIKPTLLDILTWKPDLPTDVYVVRLKDGYVTKLQTKAYFFVHHVNSYETGDSIVTDYTVWSSPELLRGMSIATQLNRTARDHVHINMELKRITIDLKLKNISITGFKPTYGAEAANKLDMPKINGNFDHKKQCYIYGLSFKADGKSFAEIALSKKDVCRPNNDKVWNKPNHYPAEPFFIAKPGGKQEDDGLLMSIILDGQLKRSYVGVFDARTMQLINRGYLPDAVPFLLHGHFEPL